MDNNQHNYASNVLETRNLVALPNTVWVADLFTSPASISPKSCDSSTLDIKVLIVVDLGSRELILATPFLVKNKGNVKSSLVCRQFIKLFVSRALEDHLQLLVHTDRGSEFTSNQFAKLFTKQRISSMSRPYTPNDNAVAERFVRIVKCQLPAAGKWPESFKTIAQAKTFLLKRKSYINGVHIGKNHFGLTANQMREALNNNKDRAPRVLLHWNNVNKFNDIKTAEIIDYKRESAQIHKEGNKRSIEQTLTETHTNAQIAAWGAMSQPAVNAAFMEQFFSLKDDMGTVKEVLDTVVSKLEKKPNTNKKRRPQLPLRDCANGSVYQFLMSQKRPKGVTRFVWSRNRLSITLLRWSGCRASDIASLNLKQITQAIKETSFQIVQPKTGTVRIIVLSPRAIVDLQAIQLDISQVFANDPEKPLASTYESNKLISTVQWLNSLNKFIEPAESQFNLVLSSHSFRVHYITSLLRSVPLQRVAKLIGHANPNTTARYDRYVPDITEMKNHVDKIE